MIKNTTIAKVDYVSGSEWQTAFREGLNTLPEQYRELVNSEAKITWNLHGGSPSSVFFRVLNDTIKTLNAGGEPSFSAVKINQDVK